MYEIEELKNDDDLELIRKLKLAWGYSDDQAIVVIGKIKSTVSEKGRFNFLQNLKNFYSHQDLELPILNAKVTTEAYIGSLSKFGVKINNGDWIKAKLELSNSEEREKHNNPLLLMVSSIEPLSEIPFRDLDLSKINYEITKINGDSYLETALLNHYSNQVKSQLTREFKEETKNARETINNELQIKKKEIEDKNKEINKKVSELKRLEKKSDEYISKLDELTEDISKHEKMLQNLGVFMANLNDVIKSKSEVLKKLELIDEKLIEKLTIDFESQDERIGHDFSTVFNSDYSQAVAYIQAFMWNNKILYRKNVLEDFFALVMTNDLIILAGDSGSGKTNLVKSFAKAIGGKSVIIPVKPNWTSAEDLLGYYNPLENKYLSTKFLDTLLEAQENPNTPYFICLDEMNLARVEYYFADFLSLLEERDEQPEIQLFSSSEGDILAGEIKNFVSLVNETSSKLKKTEVNSFFDILKDEDFNLKLHELCGFKEGDSLLKYHSYLKRTLSSILNSPTSIKLPKNVRIIGAINIDETTHYLSPKILDRVHIVKFSSPLLSDWEKIEDEITHFHIDMSLPIKFSIAELGQRKPYPEFDTKNILVRQLLIIVKNYLEPLGVEFGLRTIRQALGYAESLEIFNYDTPMVLNNIVLHKILPKLLFDGNKKISEQNDKKDILISMSQYLAKEWEHIDLDKDSDSRIELQKLVSNGYVNDWIINYWSK